MSKYKSVKRASIKRKEEELSLMVMVYTIGGLFAGYLISEFALYTRPHPIHWAGAFIAALAGYISGKIAAHYRRKNF